MAQALIKWLHEVSLKDVALVGGKNASLGEMIKNLAHAQVRIPSGFALTTNAYQGFLKDNNIGEKIFSLVKRVDINSLESLKNISHDIKNLINNAAFSDDILASINRFYAQLKNDRENFRVAVRSSASAEDLPGASFAGQQDTYLHVANFDELIVRIKDVYASLFGERAISYRAHQGFDHKSVQISVGVQEMVASDKGVAGVMFTLDPESGFNDVIFINASYGLGEAVVNGSINPDEFMIHKANIDKDLLVVLNSKLGSKSQRMVYDQNAPERIAQIANSNDMKEQYCLLENDLKSLAKSAMIIEKHYGRPMDIEWAKDGDSQEIFVCASTPRNRT